MAVGGTEKREKSLKLAPGQVAFFIASCMGARCFFKNPAWGQDFSCSRTKIPVAFLYVRRLHTLANHWRPHHAPGVPRPSLCLYSSFPERLVDIHVYPMKRVYLWLFTIIDNHEGGLIVSWKASCDAMVGCPQKEKKKAQERKWVGWLCLEWVPSTDWMSRVPCSS